MTRETSIATQEKAAQHLNAGEIDAAVDTLFAPDCVDLGIMQQLGAAPDAARKGVFGKVAEAFKS